MVIDLYIPLGLANLTNLFTGENGFLGVESE